MKKNNTDYLIHIIIKKHIETISRDETDFAEKSVSYSILQEITETIAEEFEFATSYVEKQKVKRIVVFSLQLILLFVNVFICHIFL